MDERLQKALEFANKQKTLNDALEIAQMTFDSECTYVFNGSIFKISPEMINYVHYLTSVKDRGVIMDYKNYPVMIEDLKSFREAITTLYHESSNKYLLEILKIKSKRTVDKIINE